MAVTAVYFNLVRIPSGGSGDPGESKSFSNINATTASFPLVGGKYMLDAIGSTFGTITLQKLGGDGSTWLTAATAISANGVATVDLAPGTYRVALA